MTARPERRIVWLVFGSVWLIYLATAGGSLGTGDAVAMYEVARSMLTRGATDVPANQSAEPWRGVDGRYYSPLGIGQSIFDIPFVLLGDAASRITGVTIGTPDTIPKATVALASTIPAAAAVAFGFLLAFRISGHLRASVVAAVVLAFGTLLWPYSKFGFNAALTAASLAAGIYWTAAGAGTGHIKTLVAGSAAMGFAMLTRHEMLIAAGITLAWLAWRTVSRADRARVMIAGSSGIAAALLVSLALNAARYGHPLRSGHVPELAWGGLAAFITSPSGAIWLYAPPALALAALLPRLRRLEPLAVLIALVVAAMTLFYGSLDDWLGTRSYGPRYLVPLLPLAVAPLALWFANVRRRLARFAVIALAAAGVLVQVPAVVVDFSRVGIAAGQPPQRERRDDWRWAPVRLNTIATLEAVPANVGYLTGARPLPAVTNDASSIGARVPFSLDFWWLYAAYLGVVPMQIAIAAALLLVIGAASLGRAALRLAGAPAGAGAARAPERSGIA